MNFKPKITSPKAKHKKHGHLPRGSPLQDLFFLVKAVFVSAYRDILEPLPLVDPPVGSPGTVLPPGDLGS